MNQHSPEDDDAAVPPPVEGAPVEITIETIATMVADANKFLSQVGGVAAFTNAKLGLAEWLVLVKLSQSNGSTFKYLSKSFSITPLRIKQIVDKLKSADLVSASTANDGVFSPTEKGRVVLAQINSDLTEQLIAKLDNAGRISLLSVQKRLKRLIRTLQTQSRVE